MGVLDRWELLVRKKMEQKVPKVPKISWLLDDPRNINTNYLFIV